nr:ribosomal protein L2 [Paralia sulcata]
MFLFILTIAAIEYAIGLTILVISYKFYNFLGYRQVGKALAFGASIQRFESFYPKNKMILKKSKPVTPSQRHLVRINNFFLSKTPLIKSQSNGLKNSSGRNNSGKITSFNRGGGVKRKYRKIDFVRKTESLGIVISIEYDPNRTSNIALIYDFVYIKYFYIISPIFLKVGDIVKSGTNIQPKLGNSLPIENIPVGSFIYNISIKYNFNSQISRSAGTYSQLIEKTPKYARIKVSSGEQRLVSLKCFATIGIVSNDEKFLTSIGKAGRSRWLNKRPHVRGVAMNPVDHPHGGGEGKTSGGRTSVTPWGRPTKNGKTSSSKNNLIIVKRNK